MKGADDSADDSEEEEDFGFGAGMPAQRPLVLEEEEDVSRLRRPRRLRSPRTGWLCLDYGSLGPCWSTLLKVQTEKPPLRM